MDIRERFNLGRERRSKLTKSKKRIANFLISTVLAVVTVYPVLTELIYQGILPL